MLSFYAKKSPSFPEMLQIDMISAIYTMSRNIDSSRRASTNRAAGSKLDREREREKEKAERIGKHGNFSRKLRRTSDNDGREERGTTFGERSAIYGHPSMSRVTAREGSCIRVRGCFCTYRIVARDASPW